MTAYGDIIIYMAHFKRSKYLESEVNEYIKHVLKRENDIFVLNRLKVHPREFDVIVFDKKTKYLYNFEIKRSSWRNVLDQCIVNKSYFHYCYAVIPDVVKYRKELFISNGIGVIEYKENDSEITFQLIYEAPLSDSINRFFKQKIWKIFHQKYGDDLYV